MAIAVNEVARLHGGLTVVCDGNVMDSMCLPIGGLKQGAEKLGHDVVDSISLGDEQLFYYAIQSIAPSTSADLAERSAQPTCSGRVRIWSAWKWQPAAIRLPIPVWNLQSSQV